MQRQPWHIVTNPVVIEDFDDADYRANVTETMVLPPDWDTIGMEAPR